LLHFMHVLLRTTRVVAQMYHMSIGKEKDPRGSLGGKPLQEIK